MEIDVIAIGDRNTVTQEKPDTYFETLEEYTKIARRTIAAYAPTIRVGLADEMLRNEDAVANIAHAIIMADWKFDGRGDKLGYRKDQIVWAIKSYRNRSAKHSTRRMLSLDHAMGDTGMDSFGSKIPDGSLGPADTAEQSEMQKMVHNLLDCGVLTEIQKESVSLHYLEGKTMQEIATQRGVSRQNIHVLIQRSLKELREYALDNNVFRGII